MAPALYPYIMGLALGAGFLLSRNTQRDLALPLRQRLAIALWAFCGAMIGAKLPYVFTDWPGLLSGAAWFANGKTILCGLAGGYLGVELAKTACDVRVKTGDSFAVPVAVSIAIGRLACLAGGCCYGTPTDLPWGVVFPTADGLARHPTQLYESGFHAAFAVVLVWLQKRGLFRGQLMKLYIIVYAAYRFGTELIRPEARVWAGLTVYQLGALLLVGLFAWLWRRDVRSRAARAEGVRQPADDVRVCQLDA
jgi:phosphatidylglycerol:prolipoprotein diacylglycerol transferase